MYSQLDIDKNRYKLKEISRMTGFHINTLRNWDKNGKYEFSHTDAGARYFTREQFIELLKGEGMFDDSIKNNNKRDVLYCRVSSHDQKEKGDLDRQISYLVKNVEDLKKPLILSEVGSGLNDKRKNLQKLIKMVMNDEVNRVIITYKDRLTRFGYNMLETVFNEKGVKIIVIKDLEKEKSIEKELVEDMLSIIASFSGKLYGMRSRKERNKNNEFDKKSK